MAGRHRELSSISRKPQPEDEGPEFPPLLLRPLVLARFGRYLAGNEKQVSLQQLYRVLARCLPVCMAGLTKLLRLAKRYLCQWEHSYSVQLAARWATRQR